MRALIYVATKGAEVVETASYSEKEQLAKQGYTIKEKFVSIIPPKPADALN